MAGNTGTPLRPRRLRHTAFKVSDLDASIDFYTRLLGMTVSRRRDAIADNVRPNRRSAYLTFGNEAENEALELIEERDAPEEIVHGNMFSHINISVPDLIELIKVLVDEGVEFTESPRPLVIGDRYHITFIRDPDGYEIELTDFP